MSGSYHQRLEISAEIRNLVATRTGDVFEIYVRHDVGSEVYLTSKDIVLPNNPQFAAPTANYFMGMYEAH
jgi:hypothetical protein